MIKSLAANVDSTALFLFVVAMSMACRAATMVAAAAESHVHVLDRRLQTVMARGLAGSETFRSLVAQLDASPIQVYAICDSFMPNGLAGRFTFVASVDGIRYVRVTIRCSLSSKLQLSFLAHELQHALEVAVNPEIEDADSMESYYAEAGFETHVNGRHRSFDTEAAIAVQQRVYQEMNDKPPRNDATPGVGVERSK